MYCKICGQHLYKELNLRNLFYMNDLHMTCQTILEKDFMEEVIPIDGNILYSHYLFECKQAHNYDFLFLKMMIKPLLYYLKRDNWSIIYIYIKEEYDRMTELELYLFLKLGQKPFVFLSIDAI